MSPALALIVWALGATDVAMTGWRSAAGRSGLIDKRAYYRRALLRGLVYGHAVLIPAALLMAITLRELDVPPDAVNRAVLHMLAVYLPYALVMAITTAFRLVPSVDVRSLTSVLIFGPLSFVRPVVAVVGVYAAFRALPDLILLAVALVGVAGVLSLEAYLRTLPAR